MYHVKELARLAGVTEHTIRFYTDQDLLPCQRDANNRRIFDESAVETLTVIQCLKHCGMSIEAIKRYTDLYKLGDVSLHDRYQIILEQRELAYQRLQEAQEVVAYMEQKVAYYEQAMVAKSNNT